MSHWSSTKVVQIDETSVHSILSVRSTSWLWLYRCWLKAALVEATILCLPVVSQNERIELSRLLLLLHLSVLVYINCHVHACKHICLLARRRLLHTHHLGLVSISSLLSLLGILKVVSILLLMLLMLLLLSKMLVRKSIKCWVLASRCLLVYVRVRVHVHESLDIYTTLVVVKACLISFGLLEIGKVIDRLHGVSILKIWKSIHDIVTRLCYWYHVKVDQVSHYFRGSDFVRGDYLFLLLPYLFLFILLFRISGLFFLVILVTFFLSRACYPFDKLIELLSVVPI